MSTQNVPQSPTNSQGITETTQQSGQLVQLPSDADWGIDTTSLWFPVELSLSQWDPSLWASVGTRSQSESTDFADSNYYKGHMVREYGNVRVELYVRDSRCRLEFNAARMVSPKSAALLYPDAFPSLVEHLIDELRDSYDIWPEFDHVDGAGTVSRAADWMKQVRITRLDAARNFIVTDAGNVKIGLSSVLANNQKTSHFYSRGDGWTLEHSTKTNGSDRIYDKSSELKSDELNERLKYGENMFRFEAQLRKDRLRQYGLHYLHQVSNESIWNVIDARWQTAGWGIPIPSPGEITAAVESLPEAAKDNLIGFFHRCAVGLDATMPRRYRADHARKAKRLGLTPGVPIHLLGKANRNLDLFTGQLKEINPSTEQGVTP